MAPAPAGRGAHLVVQDLRKVFMHGGRRLEILRGIRMEVRPGEMVAIVGASGVGKSTLLHVLGTLDAPTSGSIQFDGHELTRMPPARLADFRNREIGFVFQFHHLLPEFTALENVMMPALIQRMPRTESEARSRAMLERVGLAERLTHRPGELSGGEQQRVALARALVLEPRLLLADEPTGNLDTVTAAAMHELFTALNHELGGSMIVVTHNPDLAARMPRQLHMVDGVIAGQAAPPRATAPAASGPPVAEHA
jgi:lipoprotein-releasing system ATP-binding protein